MGCGTSLANLQNSKHPNNTNPQQQLDNVPFSSDIDSPVHVNKQPVGPENSPNTAKEEKRKKHLPIKEPTLHHSSEKKAERNADRNTYEGKRKNRVEDVENHEANDDENHIPVSERDLYICDPATGCCMLKPKRPKSVPDKETTTEPKKGADKLNDQQKISSAIHEERPRNVGRSDHDSGQRATLSPHGVPAFQNNEKVSLRGPEREAPAKMKSEATTQVSSEGLQVTRLFPAPDGPRKNSGNETRRRQEAFPDQESRPKRETSPTQDVRPRPDATSPGKNKQNSTLTETGPKDGKYSNSDRSGPKQENISGTRDNAQNIKPQSPNKQETKINKDAKLYLKVDDKQKIHSNEYSNTRLHYQGGYQRSSECYTESSVFTDKMLGMSFDQEFDEFVNSIPPGYLFEDLDFPADTQSLFFNPNISGTENIQWLRPYEILDPDSLPELVSNTVSSNDIMQGILGDCWFLSCCAAISKKKRLINKIIPKNQVLFGPSYRGVVRFRFWKFGNWIQVLIDDRLPTVKGKLIYGRCTNPIEFWVALVEKAYAKVHGCYEALGGGITKDAFVDLTGGIAERYDLTEYNPLIFKLIYRAHRAGGFIACSRKGDWRLSNVADANGLVPGHAYTITNAVMLYHKMGSEKLIRIKNPWGDGTKWKGSWSDNDINWQWVEEDIRDQMLQLRDDGEFWISYRDFYRQFGEVTICHLTPDLDGDGEPDEVGHMEIIKGEWILGKTAGGSRNNLVKFITNDQYLLTILESDSFNLEVDDAESEGKCNIVIALMQEQRQTFRNVKVSCYQIGFFLYESTDRLYKLPLQFFRYNPDFAKTNTFINYREVSGRFELYPGHYIIIPTTFLEDCPAHFMLRVFGEKKFLLRGPLLAR
ncbi:hypothetical protein Btru_002925 [Bulinus truncatus]|nr:hypothetical protein Btru_002925 [Bulinus truncatus]